MSRYKVGVLANEGFKSFEVELDDDTYEKLEKEKANLVRVIELLDIYDQLIDSHIESKSLFYKLSIQSAIERSEGLAFLQRVRNELNRCMFNTLNLGKLYLDMHFHSEKSLVLKITGSQTQHAKVKRLRERVFQDNPEYMVACELRGYSQHASIMTRTIHRGVQRNHGNGQLRYRVSASISREELNRKRKISKDKLERIPEKIDLQSCIDGFIDGISEMHILNVNLMRKTIEDLINNVREFAISVARVGEIEVDAHYYIEVIPIDENHQGSLQFFNGSRIAVSSEWLNFIGLLMEAHRTKTNFLGSKHEP